MRFLLPLAFALVTITQTATASCVDMLSLLNASPRQVLIDRYENNTIKLINWGLILESDLSIHDLRSVLNDAKKTYNALQEAAEPDDDRMVARSYLSFIRERLLEIRENRINDLNDESITSLDTLLSESEGFNPDRDLTFNFSIMENTLGLFSYDDDIFERSLDRLRVAILPAQNYRSQASIYSVEQMQKIKELLFHFIDFAVNNYSSIRRGPRLSLLLNRNLVANTLIGSVAGTATIGLAALGIAEFFLTDGSLKLLGLVPITLAALTSWSARANLSQIPLHLNFDKINRTRRASRFNNNLLRLVRVFEDYPLAMLSEEQQTLLRQARELAQENPASTTPNSVIVRVQDGTNEAQEEFVEVEEEQITRGE